MDFGAAHTQPIDIDDDAGARSPPDHPAELAAQVRRAGTIEEGFALARARHPLGTCLPPEVREALFVRTAKDQLLQKFLLLSARGDRDQVQDLLMWWWEKGIDTFNERVGSVRTYLRTVIAGRMLNSRRKHFRWSKIQGDATDDTVQRVSDELLRGADVEAIARLSMVLDTCPPENAMAWLLATIPGCSNEEIALITGIPLGSVSRRVAQVRERLERRFGSRDLSLAALVPVVMLQRPGVLERLRDLAGVARATARRALMSTAGRVISYGLVAAASAGVTTMRVRAPTPRVVVVERAAEQPQPSRPVPAPVAPVRPPVVQTPSPQAAPSVGGARANNASPRGEVEEFEHAAALSTTRPSTALALLAAHRRRWPTSAFALTRDAMEAELLARVGQPERARVAAERVIARSPHSPEAARVRALTRDEPGP